MSKRKPVKQTPAARRQRRYRRNQTAAQRAERLRKCKVYEQAKASASGRALQHRIMWRLKQVIGCIDCGYRENPDGLEWDHLPGCQKQGSPAALLARGWPTVLRETDKCQVACATCHAIRTQARRRAKRGW